MKKYKYIILLLAFLLNKLSGQPVDVILSTQLEVDNFSFTQPPIIGSLTIMGTDIINLNGLDSVKYINNSLNVIGTNITNLNGLNNLKFIHDNLVIRANNLLEEISALDFVEFSNFPFPGVIIIEDNPLLLTISTLNKVKYLYSNVSIKNNASLTEINGFNGLDSIGEYFPPFCSAGIINIDNNPTLQSIAGFKNLKRIGAWISIANNHNLTQISGFNSLNFVGCDLRIEEDSTLTAMTGFNTLDTIGGNFYIWNTGLANFDTCFVNLQYIGSHLWIDNNKKLSSLKGLSNLAIISKSLIVSLNPSLVSISGFGGLHYVDGISLYANHKLDSISNGFNNLEIIGNKGIDISINDSLKYINCFNSVDSILGSLSISNNPSLKTILGLQDLKHIEEDLFLGTTSFIFHSPLEDITGFDHPISIGGDLTIKNTSLSDCAVVCVCDYLLSPSGVSTIQSNQSGCNTTAQVVDACMVSVQEKPVPSLLIFSIMPNPVSSDIILRLNTDVSEGALFKFYNLLGNCVHDVKIKRRYLKGEEIQTSAIGFQNGLYICSLFSSEELYNQSCPFIVQK